MKGCKLLFVLLLALALASCQTVKPASNNTSDIIETQADIIHGGSQVEIQTRELVREIKDPVLSEKAKALESTVVRMNADIKRANAAIVEYVKVSEKNTSIMFDLAINNEKLKSKYKSSVYIIILLLIVSGIFVFITIRRLFV